MNIYSLDFVKSSYVTRGVYYVLQTDRHEESIYLSFQGTGDNAKAQKHYFLHNAPLLSSWMQVLDYDAANAPGSADAFQKLNAAIGSLPVAESKDPARLLNYLSGLSSQQAEAIISDVLKKLREVFELRPALAFLYPLFYAILHNIADHAYGVVSAKEAVPGLSMLLFRIRDEADHLQDEYDAAREYCEAVFLTANAPDSELRTENIAAIYHAYCMESGRKDFSVDYGERIAFSMIPIENISWKSYLESHKNQYQPGGKKEEYAISGFTEFLHVGTDQMVRMDSVLRVCKLCGGYFRIKYSSSQEYCTRLYGDTKAACNEYASRRSYKEKLFQHPIHQEFTRAYNKLYGRIRRGKLPADTPLMDQLKRLHDDYYERYENTHQKDREAVWKEYIEKNKELLV